MERTVHGKAEPEEGMARKKVKKKKDGFMPDEEMMLRDGIGIINSHPLFGKLEGGINIAGKDRLGKSCAARVSGEGEIFLNKDYRLMPKEWAYVIAHCLLHLAFGHFNEDNMPGYETIDERIGKTWKADCDIRLWNIACDIYVTKFLLDIKFGNSVIPPIEAYYKGPVSDEREIYRHLKENSFPADFQIFGVGAENGMDMSGLEEPLSYAEGERDWYADRFAYALASSVREAVNEAGETAYGGKSWKPSNEAEQAANWFISHYPLLGGVASGFSIVYDINESIKLEISVAAVDVENARIYVNPVAGLNEEEMRFVLAHEYLHAGLQHNERCQGRDRYLWNVACDFVINGWLKQMDIGRMPERGCLYDEQFENASAEEAYDRIISGFRDYKKTDTFRGYGQGRRDGRGFKEREQRNGSG